MLNVAVIYETAFSAGLAPDPDLSVSDWADQYRMLPRESSSEHGRWRTERTPYLREIMDELSPSSLTETVVFIKPAQIGATECGINLIGYVVHLAPGPILYVMPTVDIAKTKFSKLRLQPTIDCTPVLRERIHESRSRDSGNTLMMKEFLGGSLILGGANSAAALRSMPIRFLILDELDAYPADVEGEGDPAALAMKRTTTFAMNRKHFIPSTPTVKGQSRIEKFYEESDQRRYYVPCPTCGHEQHLRWQQVKFAHEDHRLVGAVTYECEACSVAIPQTAKTEMLTRGRWIAAAPGEGKSAGFHLNGLYSPVGWLTWEEIVQEFLGANRENNQARLKQWVNTVLAETWEEAADKVEVTDVESHRSPYGPEVPAGAAVLTAGVDVQKDRLEVEVRAYGPGEESWGMEYRSFQGDPSSADAWARLEEFLGSEFPSELGIPLRIHCTCIDIGGHHTNAVYGFVARLQNKRRIFAIKGSSQGNDPVVKRGALVAGGKVRLFIVGVSSCKETIMSRLRIAEPGPGYMHFPPEGERGYSMEYSTGLVSEKMRWRHGRKEWVKVSSGARNEPLDCAVYNLAALRLYLQEIRKTTLDRETERLRARAQRAPGAPGAPVTSPSVPAVPIPIKRTPRSPKRPRGTWMSR